jgi:hypothetical protein
MPTRRARPRPIHPHSTSLCIIVQTSVQAEGEQGGRIVKVERRGRRRARPARLGWARAGKADRRIHDSCRDTSSFQSGRTLKALPHFVQGALRKHFLTLFGARGGPCMLSTACWGVLAPRQVMDIVADRPARRACPWSECCHCITPNQAPLLVRACSHSNSDRTTSSIRRTIATASCASSVLISSYATSPGYRPAMIYSFSTAPSSRREPKRSS